MDRPNLEDYEFYDPQSMQEYSYRVEEYIDYLESIIPAPLGSGTNEVTERSE